MTCPSLTSPPGVDRSEKRASISCPILSKHHLLYRRSCRPNLKVLMTRSGNEYLKDQVYSYRALNADMEVDRHWEEKMEK
ncbi:uncharacterized protein G2W53_015658 [Senna tora]|uniref:Uncharacterized protein n=1 Tax=Senna tora TaxID=362788 RepID=A0A835C844_9FABA|nr:uncharacterized protein G2W53_015658 [Senna tora]